MDPARTKSFRDRFKEVVDKICSDRGATRQELAEDLGVHIHSLSSAAYRGDVSFDHVSRLAGIARLGPQDLAEMELAYMELQAQRNRNVGRAVGYMADLIEQLSWTYQWIEKQGLGAKYNAALRRKQRERPRWLDGPRLSS